MQTFFDFLKQYTNMIYFNKVCNYGGFSMENIQITDCIEQSDATAVTGLTQTNYLKVTNFDDTNSITINPDDNLSSPITVPPEVTIEYVFDTPFAGITIVNGSSVDIQILVGRKV